MRHFIQGDSIRAIGSNQEFLIQDSWIEITEQEKNNRMPKPVIKPVSQKISELEAEIESLKLKL